MIDKEWAKLIEVIDAEAMIATHMRKPDAQQVCAISRKLRGLRESMARRRNVWLVTSGSGEDGDEWCVHSIHSTKKGATERASFLNQLRRFVSSYTVEQWEVDAELGDVV
jgi:hypothetical protein